MQLSISRSMTKDVAPIWRDFKNICRGEEVGKEETRRGTIYIKQISHVASIFGLFNSWTENLIVTKLKNNIEEKRKQ